MTFPPIQGSPIESPADDVATDLCIKYGYVEFPCPDILVGESVILRGWSAGLLCLFFFFGCRLW